MKVFISLDLEGITGVFAEDQTTVGTASYEEARSLLRADLDAVVSGCLAAGATAIVVADGHDKGANLPAEDLPAEVSVVAGSPAPLSMMQGVDAGFAAAMLIGYHARAGTAGAVLEHTYSYDVQSVRIGDVEVGELAINGAVAGAFGVPVVLVSGDDKVAAEARRDLPGAGCVVVKEGFMRTNARLFSTRTARAELREAAARALSAGAEPAGAEPPAPLDYGGRPMTVTFRSSGLCDAASRCPSARRVDGSSLEIAAADYLSVFTGFLACTELARLSHCT